MTDFALSPRRSMRNAVQLSYHPDSPTIAIGAAVCNFCVW